VAAPGRATASTSRSRGRARNPQGPVSAAAPGSAARPGHEQEEPSPGFLAAAYTVLFLLGVVLGLLGTFLLAAGPRSGGTLVLPIGLAIALVGHPVAGWLGLRITGTRAGTLTPLLGWCVVVLPLSSGTPNGDVVLPSSLLSILFLLVGIGTFGVVALLTRPTRGRSASLRG
jgi:hypothetical protein